MEKTYTNSAYYNIRLTSRMIKLHTLQLLEKINAKISLDEVFTLDILKTNGKMSQRDLAKMLFKDRANTGKLALGLKNKELIDIIIETKKNRITKQLYITEKGEKLLSELWKKSKPFFDKVFVQFSEKEDILLQEMLEKLRNSIKNSLEIQI